MIPAGMSLQRSSFPSLTGRVLKSLTAEPQERAVLRLAFECRMLQNLKYLTLGLAFLYVFFLISHFLLFPGPVRTLLAPVDVATVAYMLIVYSGVANGRIPPRWAHPLAMVTGILILSTDRVTFFLVPQGIALNWILVQIAAGSFAFSLDWVAAFLTFSLVAWFWTTFSSAHLNLAWATAGIAVSASAALSLLIQISRLRTFGQLELSSLRMRHLSDAALEGIVLIRSGRIFAANRSMAKMFGYEEAELIGKTVDEILDVRGNEPFGRRKNGEIFPVKSGRRVISSGPELLIAVAVQDLTERKEAERTIEEQRKAMIQSAKMSALGEMAAGISHEINNPLSAMMARIELLASMAESKKVSGEKISEYLTRVHADGKRIGRIVQGLGTFARDASHDPFEPVSIKGVIEDSLSFMAQKFLTRGIRLHIESGCADPQIECRPTQISQVLVNLLSNAFDAVENRAEKWIRISCRDLGDTVEISVTDSGEGIPPGAREKIMQPFFTTKGPRRGTGLGLSISKGLIEAHRGVLELDPRSKNTRFFMRIPKRQGAFGREAA